MTTKERVVDLVQRLSDEDLALVEPILVRLAPPSLADLQARWDALPEDDEPLSEEDRAALAESLAAYERGEGISHEEIGRRLRRRQERAA